ncbi:MAG: glycosyltransferase family 4 protein [Nanoarchaeota archaeon]
MKILFVLDYYFPYTGGSEILFKTLAEGLASRGHEVTVLTAHVAGAKKNEVLNSVSVHRIAVPSVLPRYFFMKLSFFWLVRHAKKYDIIHTTSCGSSLSAWLASKMFRVPSVITVHEVIGSDWSQFYGMGRAKAWAMKLLERIMVTRSHTKHVTVSHSTRRNLEKLGVKKISVVHNALDYNHWNPRRYTGFRKNMRDELGVGPKEFLYVFYGRPGVSKGVEYLIKAIPKIAEKIPFSRALFIMGREPAERYSFMKKLLKKHGKGRAILHNPVGYGDLPKYLMAADAVVVPSITEGFGFCVAESCALGKPVVASNTTSIPEVVSGKFVLVPPKNPSAIASGVEMVKKKRYMKTPLKKFSVEKFLDGYERVYKRLQR